jgi:hypothetical protein
MPLASPFRLVLAVLAVAFFAAGARAAQEYVALENADLEAFVAEHTAKGPTLVYFSSYNCPPCIRLAPTVDQLAAAKGAPPHYVKIELGALRGPGVAKLGAYARKHDMWRVVPLLAVIDKGEVKSWCGTSDMAVLTRWIETGSC